MIAREINVSEHAVYDELALCHGTLFNRSDWLSLFGERMKRCGFFDDGGTMVGGFSLYQERRMGLKIFRSAPFTPICGPFLNVKSQNPVAVLEERRKILACMVEHLRKESPAICMLPLDQRITDTLPFFWNGYKTIPSYTYLLNLELSLEQIKGNMSSERRKNLAKAAKDGLRVRQESDMTVVRELVLATFGRQRKHIDRQSLDNILFTYAKPSNSFAFVAYRGSSPIATCFIVHDVNTAYYLLGGYNSDEKHHGAGVLAMFEAIRYSQELGVRTFDFEGSVIPPIERYFRGFGGQLTPYYTVNKAWTPLEILLKFFKRERF